MREAGTELRCDLDVRSTSRQPRIVTLLRLNEEAVSWTEVDGEILALERESSTYLSTNRSGAIIWNSLVRGASRQQMIAAVMQTFGVDEPTAAADTDAFVDVLAHRGLLLT